MTGSERFCQNLVNMRMKAGMSQEEFAASCGMQTAYYGKLERKQSSPTLKTVEKVCAKLGVSIADMVEREVEAPAYDATDIMILEKINRFSEEYKALALGMINLLAKEERKYKKKQK